MKGYRRIGFVLTTWFLFLSLEASTNDIIATPFTRLLRLSDAYGAREFLPREVAITVSGSYYGQLERSAAKVATDQQEEEATSTLYLASTASMEGAAVERRVIRYEHARRDSDGMMMWTAAPVNRRAQPDHFNRSRLFLPAADTPVPAFTASVRAARMEPLADSALAMEQGLDTAMQSDSSSKPAQTVFLRPSRLSFWQAGILQEEEDTENRRSYLSSDGDEIVLLLPLLLAWGFDAFRSGGISSTPLVPIPEPASVASLLVGVGLLAAVRNRGARRKGRLHGGQRHL